MNLEEEFAKVRAVLHQIVDRIHLPSETEVRELKTAVDLIAEPTAPEAPPVVSSDSPAPPAPGSVVPPPAFTGTAPAAPSFAEAGASTTPDPLASYSLAELENEFARRQAAS